MSDMDLADRLLATLRIRMPGVTSQALNLELFNTIDEFLKSTSAWRWSSSIPLEENLQRYPLFPPAGTDLVQVLAAEFKGFNVPPLVEETPGSSVTLRGRLVGEALAPDYDSLFEPNVTVSPGGIFAYSIFFPTYIAIDIPPSADAALYPLNLLLALTLNYECLEDEPNEWPLEPWMWGTFHEAFVDGTQGRMMSQVSKPWSNPQVAQYHMKRFRKFIGRAKQTAARGYTYNTPNWRFPRWA